MHEFTLVSTSHPFGLGTPFRRSPLFLKREERVTTTLLRGSCLAEETRARSDPPSLVCLWCTSLSTGSRGPWALASTFLQQRAVSSWGLCHKGCAQIHAWSTQGNAKTLGLALRCWFGRAFGFPPNSKNHTTRLPPLSQLRSTSSRVRCLWTAVGRSRVLQKVCRYQRLQGRTLFLVWGMLPPRPRRMSFRRGTSSWATLPTREPCGRGF